MDQTEHRIILAIIKVTMYQQKSTEILKTDELRMACLESAKLLGLKDWYIGAGFVRNAIWDHLHNKSQSTPLNDVDLVYFDSSDTSLTTEKSLEAQLQSHLAEVKWQVRNQARMHLKHNHQPYRDTSHAISHWPEIPTCVGVRLDPDSTFLFTAPFGLEQNWSLVVKPNIRRIHHSELFNSRVRDKGWATIWPGLVIHWA